MSFFDKLNANLTNAGRTVSQKVKNSNEVSKLTSEINAAKRTIQEKQTEIGRMYYDIHKDSETDEAFREPIDIIRKSEQRITELLKEIEVVRTREPELVPIPEDVPAPKQASPSAMICMNCGNTYAAGNAFCPSCGQKLTAQYPSAAAAASAPVQTADDVQNQQVVLEKTAPADEIIEAEYTTTETPQEITPETAPEPETTQFCPYCGEKIALPNQEFCGNCGHAL